MSYASLKFLFFVLFLMGVYYVFPRKYRWIVLLMGNIIFYCSFSGILILYAVFGTVISFVATNLMSKYSKKKKIILLFSIIIELSLLLLLKYNNFFASIFNKLFKFTGIVIPYKKFILPIGISYFILEMISYIVDVYRKKIDEEKNIFKLFTFFIYFPKVVEGPFSRYSDLSKNMFNSCSFDYERFRKAFVLIGYGFFLKLVISDRLGIFVNNFFDEGYCGPVTILAMIFYTFQLYTDFSGCIDIVTGISELFGIDLAKNFNQPFFSTSINEFWRRWHITLGNWLKEYVFYPISLSKMNLKLNLKLKKIKSKHLSKFIRTAFPLLFVWLCNGLWHGPSIKYVIYGLYYYVLMMIGILLKPIFDKIISFLKINVKNFSYKFFQIIRTFFIVCIGMLMFRSVDLKQFFTILSKINVIDKTFKFKNLGLTSGDMFILLIGFIIIFSIGLAKELKIDVRSKLEEQNMIFRWITYLIIIFSILLFGIYGKGYSAASFIYGGF